MRSIKSRKKANKYSDKTIAASEKRRSAKTKLSNSYDELKRANRADRGRRLYAKGKTVTANAEKMEYAQKFTVLAAGLTVAALAQRSGITQKLGEYAGLPDVSFIPPDVMDKVLVASAGATAVSLVPLAKWQHENKTMRGYWHYDKKHLKD